MKQLVLSDLHLGARSSTDLLRRAEMRAPLLAALEDVDRLVLLGDALEMRDGPAHEPLAAARALFKELGRGLGPDREVVMVPGNHDHELVGPWLEARRRVANAPPLELEQLAGPEASPLAQVIDDWLGPTPLRMIYCYGPAGDVAHWRQELEGTLPRAGIESPPLPEGAQPQCTQKPGENQ